MITMDGQEILARILRLRSGRMGLERPDPVRRLAMKRFCGIGLSLALVVAVVAPQFAGGGVDTATGGVAVAKEGKVKEHRSGDWDPGLTEAEKETLFAIVRDTLEWCVKDRTGEFKFEKYAITETLRKPTHSFVTLKLRNMLRGCIGSLPPMAADPMYLSVHQNAINAALRDWRFPPVTPGELERLDVYISLLSPVKDIKSLDEFHIGEHGIILIKGGHRAVYLPEVAVEQGWSKEETLESLSEKAGLPSDAWKQGARFQVFSSVVLSK